MLADGFDQAAENGKRLELVDSLVKGQNIFGVEPCPVLAKLGEKPVQFVDAACCFERDERRHAAASPLSIRPSSRARSTAFVIAFCRSSSRVTFKAMPFGVGTSWPAAFIECFRTSTM